MAGFQVYQSFLRVEQGAVASGLRATETGLHPSSELFRTSYFTSDRINNIANARTAPHEHLDMFCTAVATCTPSLCKLKLGEGCPSSGKPGAAYQTAD